MLIASILAKLAFKFNVWFIANLIFDWHFFLY